MNAICELRMRLTPDEYAAVASAARAQNVHLTSVVRKAVLASVGLPYKPLRNVRPRLAASLRQASQLKKLQGR